MAENEHGRGAASGRFGRLLCRWGIHRLMSPAINVDGEGNIAIGCPCTRCGRVF